MRLEEHVASKAGKVIASWFVECDCL